MQKISIAIILIFVLSAAVFSAILPYPIFSNYTNLSEKNMFEINNHYETELQNIESERTKILELGWFSSIDFLLPIGSEFEILDLTSDLYFSVIRTGGKNHADVESCDSQSSTIFKETILSNLTWQRRPVLVKINENAYLPASLSAYPHGFITLKDNPLNGHLCLHFKNSKTHGTNLVDDHHQECIKTAEKLAKKTLKSL